MFPELCGWTENQQEVENVCRSILMPFYQAPAPKKVDSLLYQFYRKIRGSDDLAFQGIGDCVSWGFMHLVDYIQAIEIYRDIEENTTPDQDYGFEDTATEVIYALSRHEIGRDQIRGDGSVGAWAAKAISEIGTISRPQLERTLGLGQGKYSAQRAREWGRSGLPDDLEPIAKQHKIETVSLVSSVNDAAWHLEQGNPIAVCSNILFENGSNGETRRDKQGFATPRGKGGHCMAVIGIRWGQRPGACILNQWPPSAFSGPLDLDQPENSFWIELDILEKMLAQGDSWTASTFKGYPVRPLTFKF
jgi:hypothetical protein